MAPFHRNGIYEIYAREPPLLQVAFGIGLRQNEGRSLVGRDHCTDVPGERLLKVVDTGRLLQQLNLQLVTHGILQDLGDSLGSLFGIARLNLRKIELVVPIARHPGLAVDNTGVGRGVPGNTLKVALQLLLVAEGEPYAHIGDVQGIRTRPTSLKVLAFLLNVQRDSAEGAG